MADIPSFIGKYKIEDIVARGGMGMVFRAVHPTLKREIIIKQLTIRGNAQVLERFKREARILLDLQHANIVHMFDYFVEGSFHYIVLEYVDGMSLDKLLAKKTKLAWPTALLVIGEACKALQHAHSKGIIHRDIKPGNILMSKKGKIKLADFGIAVSAQDEAVEDSITRAGTTLGTPAYMPPEQFADSKSVDARADIYALGIMLYEMVTGKKPYKGNMAPETIKQIQKGRYIPPQKLESSLPPKLVRLIRKMMQAKPSRRFQNVSQVLKLVSSLLNRFSLQDLRLSLVKLMFLPAYTEPVFVPKRKNLYKRLIALCAFVVLTAAGIISWQQGLIHRFFLRRWYTPVSITMKIPPSASTNPDIPMGAFFFFNDDKEIPEVANSRRFFTKSKNALPEDAYTIRPVYLRQGSYRIKIVVGPYLSWQSAAVGRDKVVLSMDLRSQQERSLVIHASARDGLRGNDISTKTLFSVLIGKSWIPITELQGGQLTSGTVWKIKAEAAGYQPEVFSLRIEWYQDELSIFALLKPK